MVLTSRGATPSSSRRESPRWLMWSLSGKPASKALAPGQPAANPIISCSKGDGFRKPDNEANGGPKSLQGSQGESIAESGNGERAIAST